MTLKKKAIEQRILKATGIKVSVEDNAYALLPLGWYFKKPWLGLKRLDYLGEAFDCDDFCDVFKVELVKRHLKKAGNYMEGEAYPALPVFKAKVALSGQKVPHWVMLVIHDDGVEFIERTKDSIELVVGIRKIYKVVG